jgi:hypothetical protein
MKVEEFDKVQYTTGHSCYNCGYPKMGVVRSKQTVKDGFVPGYQKNIRKHCWTYKGYQDELKKMGLVELGYEDVQETDGKGIKYWTPDMLKKLYDITKGKYSDRELDAIGDGKIEGLY